MTLDAGRMVRATRVPTGPATTEVSVQGGVVEAAAWGPGAEQALDELPDVLGVGDDPTALRPRHRLLSGLQRRFAGLRIGCTRSVFEAAVPAVIEQRITGHEAWRVFRTMVRRFGERAPGPHGLWLLPSPETIASLAYFDLHNIGLERRRAETIRTLARLVDRYERVEPERAMHVLGSVPGVGPWTLAEIGLRAHGDADALSVGDYHVPSLVTLALAGEGKGSDDRMLELLEPYRGQRARVVRLLELGGPRRARRGPRLRSRSLERI
jgi:3-methyladenine DNA glycosylase/8-oxoguanine DNA glycosylase